mmetsp:Transcript_41064/g.133631  ORF Transcript_41064/g.133631 Transcript_41064/m.133631 type:complete len:211 (+) Transcript_41064:2116-2748(+)
MTSRRCSPRRASAAPTCAWRSAAGSASWRLAARRRRCTPLSCSIGGRGRVDACSRCPSPRLAQSSKCTADSRRSSAASPREAPAGARATTPPSCPTSGGSETPTRSTSPLPAAPPFRETCAEVAMAPAPPAVPEDGSATIGSSSSSARLSLGHSRCGASSARLSPPRGAAAASKARARRWRSTLGATHCRPSRQSSPCGCIALPLSMAPV